MLFNSKPHVSKGRTHQGKYKMGEMELKDLLTVLLPKLRAVILFYLFRNILLHFMKIQ